MHEFFKQRHSVRKFQGREVSASQVDEILEAADSAPSAGGLKAREVSVVRDAAAKKKIAEAARGQQFIAEAPVVLVFWALPSRSAQEYGKRGEELYALQDATIAASFAWLQAVALGLAACWVGAFDEAELRAILSAGEDRRPIAILPVGYEVR